MPRIYPQPVQRSVQIRKEACVISIGYGHPSNEVRAYRRKAVIKEDDRSDRLVFPAPRLFKQKVSWVQDSGGSGRWLDGSESWIRHVYAECNTVKVSNANAG